jgi:hypothetical protein
MNLISKSRSQMRRTVTNLSAIAALLFVATAGSAQNVYANRVLRTTRFTTDTTSGAITIPSGVVALDSPGTINCPGTSGTCTLEIDQHVQVGGSQVASNQVGICTMVDGAFLPCPILGVVPLSGFWATPSFVQVRSGLGLGSHTVQTFVSTVAGGSRSSYSVTYRIYKP